MPVRRPSSPRGPSTRSGPAWRSRILGLSWSGPIRASAGEDGAVHQMNQDVALMRILLGISILVPSDFDSSSAMAMLASETPKPRLCPAGP